MSARQPTAEELQNQVTALGITEWHIFDCGICDKPVKFTFEPDNRVIMHSLCECSVTPTPPFAANWSLVLQYYAILFPDSRVFWGL